ncbi:MAG: hypothetical protein WCF57_10365 [Pyrinomonadaceae bacterium]
MNNRSISNKRGLDSASARRLMRRGLITFVVSTGDMALNVAGLLSGAGAAKVAIQKGIKAASKQVLTAAGRRAMLAQAKKKLRDTAREKGQDIAEEILNTGSEALVSSYEKGEFDWTVLDPIGVTAVIEAFNKPICGR